MHYYQGPKEGVGAKGVSITKKFSGGSLQVMAEGGGGLSAVDLLIVMGMTGPQNDRGQVAVLNYEKPGGYKL